MMTLNRSALVLALLGAGCLSGFAQDGGTLEIAVVPAVSDTTTSADPLANLSAAERESLLTKASIEAGYGEPYPADNPEAMAIIYDYAAQMLAASNAVAKEEILPVDGEVLITETGDIVPKEELIYTMTSTATKGGSVGGDVQVKNRFGQTVRSLAAALKMYDADRRSGIGRALSHEAQALLASLKMYDAEAGRLASKATDPVKGKGIGGFDRAMLGGASTGDLVIDIRETTSGLDVEYRIYGPGQAHWGSASFASATGGAKEVQTWFMEVVSGKNIRKNISVNLQKGAAGASESQDRVRALDGNPSARSSFSGGGVTFDKREVTGGERKGTIRTYTVSKVNWANVVVEKSAVQGEPSSASKFSKYGSTVFEFKGGNGATPTGRSVQGGGILIPQIDAAIETLARVSSLLEALAAQTGNDTLLEVAAALQEQIKLRQGLKVEMAGGIPTWWGICHAAAQAERLAHEAAHVVQQRAGADIRTAAHEAAHVVQQRTGSDEVWNQPAWGLVTETTLPALMAAEGKKGLNAVNVKLSMMPAPTGPAPTAQEGKKGPNAVNVKLAIAAPASTSQTFNTLTNVQKSKHDAAMAAIQNTR